MKIETKYNVGDKLWMIDHNEPYLFAVKRIKIECDSVSSYKAFYCGSGDVTKVGEDRCFSSIEELKQWIGNKAGEQVCH